MLVDAALDLDAVRDVVRRAVRSRIVMGRGRFYRYVITRDLASPFTRAYQGAVLALKGFNVSMPRYAEDVASVGEVVLDIAAEAEAVLK